MANPQLVVVIPCHDEPDLLTTLDSLWRCRPPPCVVEVVVVINGSERDPPSVQAQNRQTWVAAQAWIDAHQEPDRLYVLLFEPTLPDRQAGVGTARKIGMDWAVTRFDGTWREQGIIVCLDADCVVAVNYLEALHAHFTAYPQTPGCAIYFEHPLAGLSPRHRQSIVHYELYLRYYLHGLRWSGFPHAFHTVGSSMAVRAGPYRRQGGMNRRKAGEDFYFLQKMIPLGAFSDLCTTTVFPSPRQSHRVPFGTGRAMIDDQTGAKDLRLVCDPQIFDDLGSLFMRVEQLYLETAFDQLPHTLLLFLSAHQWPARLAEMRANTTTLPTFRKRFFQGFNGFHLLKYVHFAMEQSKQRVDVTQAAAILLEKMGMESTTTEREELLTRYRQLDQNGHWHVGFERGRP